MSLGSSAAGQVLRSRALQCSFSSVFHLRRAGMDQRDASFIENLFIGTVGMPLVLLGVGGLATGWSLSSTTPAVVNNSPPAAGPL
jgi:hypothetical protein